MKKLIAVITALCLMLCLAGLTVAAQVPERPNPPRLVNDFAGELRRREDTDLPATTKEDGRHHGLGLANIARCAEKYRGTVDIGTEAKEGRQKFRLVVMLYQRTD